MNEIWKNIKGYEEFYQVSNLGRIKCLNKTITYNQDGREKSYARKQSIMRTNQNGKYTMIILCADGHRKSMRLHRLVATHFIENPENKKEVNHKDGNKKNNSVENLEWATSKENSLHAYVNRLNLPPNPKGEDHGMAKLNRFQVERMRLLKECLPIIKFKELGRLFKVSKSQAFGIIKKQSWKHII